MGSKHCGCALYSFRLDHLLETISKGEGEFEKKTTKKTIPEGEEDAAVDFCPGRGRYRSVARPGAGSLYTTQD